MKLADRIREAGFAGDLAPNHRGRRDPRAGPFPSTKPAAGAGLGGEEATVGAVLAGASPAPQPATTAIISRTAVS
jgi:hypothetical protein